jgi:glucose-1-phosphate thymidylyltransferase
VPVANRPILYYGLDALAEAGITEVAVVVGATATEVKAAVRDGSDFGLSVTYLEQEAPLGLAHAVRIARDFLGSDPFVMYLGDNLLREGLTGLVEQFDEERSGPTPPPAALVLLAEVPDPSRFGVAVLDGAGRLVGLVEKPAHPPSPLALVGVYLFDERIHEAVAAIGPSARGELEITDAIQYLMDRGHPVSSRLVEGWWVDTGDLESLLAGNRLVMGQMVSDLAGTAMESQVEGPVVLGPGAVLIRSKVCGPAVIGPRCRVIDSYIGPYTSLSSECHIERVEVENSIVLSGSRLLDCGRLEGSLIGKNVEVGRSGTRPLAMRLMIGDHCRVDLV